MRQLRFYLVVGSFLIGMLFAAWQFQFFYIIFPTKKSYDFSLKQAELTKKVLFFIPSKNIDHGMQQHYISVVWDAKNAQSNIEHVGEKWLFLQQELGHISKNIFIESIMLDQQKSVLYVSFSHSFIKKRWSLLFTMQMLASLAKTIVKHWPNIQQLCFLVNHKPHPSMHLDLSLPVSINTLLEY